MAKNVSKSNNHAKRLRASARKQERKEAASHDEARQLVEDLGISAKMVVNLAIDDSIIDHSQEILSSREGRRIGMRNEDLSSIGRTLTIYDMRKARLGEEVSYFLGTVESSCFPIVNTVFRETYGSPSDGNLFHRFFSYMMERIYLTSCDLSRKDPSFNDDSEMYVWTYYADRMGETFVRFLNDECRQAA